MIARVPKRLNYSFLIGLALFVVCLIYIPQWRQYAPRTHQSVPTSPYLTPWTVVSVSALSLALVLIASPVRAQNPVRIILSKALSTVVFCFAAVFLLEYACGIRVPDLDVFFLPDSSGQRVTLYAARPTPQSATTSLLFAVALIVYQADSIWRKKAYQVFILAALVLPTLASFGYLFALFFPPSAPRIGLSLPAVVLYFTLGSGVLGLSFESKVSKPAISGPVKTFKRWV
jgi:hypothetical protein